MKIFTLQKKILNLVCSIFAFLLFLDASYAMKSNHGLDGYVENRIDAAKNARMHSNMGNIYFFEKKYISALKEYELAFNLSINSQSSGVYLYNIAKCHYILTNYSYAQKAILGAINKDCINITYYDFLVDCFIKLNTTEKELEKYLLDVTNPYNKIVVGLIYLKTDRKMQAKATFDDFIVQYPDMLIADDVRLLINRI